MGSRIDMVKYSRISFLFPDEQPFIHQSFDAEVDFLNLFFDGKGYVIGPTNGLRWHIYIADMRKEHKSPDQSLEIVMYDLPESVMSMFYREKLEAMLTEVIKEKNFQSMEAESGSEASNFGSKYLGEYVAGSIGIDTIIPGSSVDSFLFDPCGYSCNALNEEAYFTIHITPELEFSFVSFDTNLSSSCYDSILRRVLEIFQPGKFSVCLFAEENAVLEKPVDGLSWKYSSFNQQLLSSQIFPGIGTLSYAHFESENPCKYGDFSALENNILKSADGGEFSLVLDSLKKHLPIQKLIYNEHESVSDFMLSMKENRSTKDEMLVIDFSQILKRLSRWRDSFPGSRTYFELSENRNVYLLSVLNSLGCGFICSSVYEAFSFLRNSCISASNILYSGYFKSVGDLRLLRDCGINQLILRSDEELDDIIKVHPKADLFLRVILQSDESEDSSSVSRDGVSDLNDIISHPKASLAKIIGISARISHTPKLLESNLLQLELIASKLKRELSLDHELLLDVDVPLHNPVSPSVLCALNRCGLRKILHASDLFGFSCACALRTCCIWSHGEGEGGGIDEGVPVS
jgi:S-adenosylmethionine decarboxylase proenzyme